MSFEKIRQFCVNLPLVTEDFPFDNKTIVWKVAGKMFCLGDTENFDSINVKCNPQKAIELRETYWQVKPGYHMNKTMWNTILLDELPENFIFSQINHSYEEVVQKLPSTVKKLILYK
jgi:predicted DNA-binding protein (MmcQ/YjbR family)